MKISLQSFRYVFALILFCAMAACKKERPADPVVPAKNKDYRDFQLANMAVNAGYYITDTTWSNFDIASVIIRKNFANKFLFPLETNTDLYLGAAIDGAYFKTHEGALKSYQKYARTPLDNVFIDASRANRSRIKNDLQINSTKDMEELVQTYLSGTAPSEFASENYLNYPFTNYNQLKLFFGREVNIRGLLGIPANVDMTKVENGLVYYNEDETFRLEYRKGGKPLFQSPFDAEQVREDDAGYIDKVTYGKISMMTADSKLPWRELRDIIYKVRTQKGLSSEESAALQSTSIYTYLRGYSQKDEKDLSAAKTPLDKIRAFGEITNEQNFTAGWTAKEFTYGNHGAPISFTIRSASNVYDNFLKDHHYAKIIRFQLPPG